jgi:hypothetical protein
VLFNPSTRARTKAGPISRSRARTSHSRRLSHKQRCAAICCGHRTRRGSARESLVEKRRNTTRFSTSLHRIMATAVVAGRAVVCSSQRPGFMRQPPPIAEPAGIQPPSSPGPSAAVTLTVSAPRPDRPLLMRSGHRIDPAGVGVMLGAAADDCFHRPTVRRPASAIATRRKSGAERRQPRAAWPASSRRREQRARSARDPCC